MTDDDKDRIISEIFAKPPDNARNQLWGDVPSTSVGQTTMADS